MRINFHELKTTIFRENKLSRILENRIFRGIKLSRICQNLHSLNLLLQQSDDTYLVPTILDKICIDNLLFYYLGI